MPPLDSGKQERIEDFLRKSLLGEELINTQFHLFSARSVSSRRLTRPRVLCANNVLLAESSTYFLDLLGSDISPSDPALSDITGASDIPTNVQIDDFGYGSDSDLDDDDEPPILMADTKPPGDRPTIRSTSPHQISTSSQSKDDNELSEDDNESVGSDMFVMSPEHPSLDEPLLLNLDRAGSVTSNETAVQEIRGNKIATSRASVSVWGLGGRHVLVKDTAFRTWYTLLNHLYTGKINFLPLTSAASGGQSRECSTGSSDGPRCSAKSMYRLACKVGLDHLRDEALAHIRSSLTEQNILKELSCSLATKHPQLLEMELDVLYTHIASPPVVTGFPALAQRIANKEVPHGADIVIGIHTRFLKECRPSPSTLRTSLPLDPSPASSPVLALHPAPSSPTPLAPAFPYPAPSSPPLAPAFPHLAPSSPTLAPPFHHPSIHTHFQSPFTFGESQMANGPIPNDLFTSEIGPSDMAHECNAGFGEPSKIDSDTGPTYTSKGKPSSSTLAMKKKKR